MAIVTGASQGVGAALVAAYRTLGFGVVAIARTIATSNDEHVVAVAGDIRERATAEKAVAAARERFGRVDTLVNDPGMFICKPFLEYTQEDFETVIGTNVTGLFHTTQVVLGTLLPQRSGHIVNISASLIDQPYAQLPAGLAALAKGGMNALTKSLAIEVAAKGVRVNAVAPSLLDAPVPSPATEQVLSRMHPLGRMCEVKDVVDAVLYLEAASFVTGAVLHVDGGMAAGVA